VHFAVNADRTESDLTPAAAEVERAVVAELTRDNGVLPEAGVATSESELASAGPAGDEGGRTLLWPYILAGLFLLFGAEAVLVVRG